MLARLYDLVGYATWFVSMSATRMAGVLTIGLRSPLFVASLMAMAALAMSRASWRWLVVLAAAVAGAHFAMVLSRYAQVGAHPYPNAYLNMSAEFMVFLLCGLLVRQIKHMISYD
jgi:hypothetical protein